VRRIKEDHILGTITTIGLVLPFIGNILASWQIGEFPLYLGFEGPMGNINSYLWFVFVMQAYTFLSVALCIICYKYCTRLKQCRYIPICAVYLFIFCFHYVMTFVLHADPFGWLIVFGYVYFIPIFWIGSLFVFWFAIIFAFFVAGFSGTIEDSDFPETSLSEECPQDENKDLESKPNVHTTIPPSSR
jgi:hypothetical protein